MCIIALLGLRIIFVHRNKNKAANRDAAGYQKRVNGEFLDLTDRENPGENGFALNRKETDIIGAYLCVVMEVYSRRQSYVGM